MGSSREIVGGRDGDYPNELTQDRQGRDRIKILEDTNGDGRCDVVKVFAEGLNVPTSIVFANGGVIVATLRIFFSSRTPTGTTWPTCEKILNTGWGVADTHAGPSNLRYGLDNRIWGTVGYSGYRGRQERMRFASGTASFT